jgi:hypothetical protein
MRLTPANWNGSRVAVQLPARAQTHAVTCTVPALASAQTKWQERQAALAQGQLIVGSRLGFGFNSTEFMNTPGGTLTLLVEIADPGQANWRTYVQSTHESGLLQKPTNPQDPQTWPMPTGIPDLWDGDTYDIRITATCSLNVQAGLHYDVF